MKITIDGKTFDTDNPDELVLGLRAAFAEQAQQLGAAYHLAYQKAYGAALAGRFEGARFRSRTIGPTPDHPNGQEFSLIEIEVVEVL